MEALPGKPEDKKYQMEKSSLHNEGPKLTKRSGIEIYNCSGIW